VATAYVTHPDCSLHDPGWGRVEHQGRLPAVARAVYRDMLTLFPALHEMEGRPAGPANLELAHDPEYLRRLARRVGEAREAGHSLDFEGGVPVSAGSGVAALAAVGCAVTAVDAVTDGEVENAFCAVRPPGHRVGRAVAGGHGLLNPVAVAALHLRRHREVARVLVVDLGARAGLGTAAILRAEPGVRVLLAAPDAAEGEGGEAVLTARLPADGDLAAVLPALESGLDRAVADAEPGIVLLSLGFDLLASDPSSSLRLHPAGYHVLTRLLTERVRAWCSGRLVSVLEEGYDAAGMGAGVVQHLRALAGLDPA
jgi:acetoin utilization deacetylase AcuC-like enzyme